MASKGQPYRTVNIGGFEVMIGRSADDNDRLTFDVGKPPDLWLHVAQGIPGSHVIVRNPNRIEIPKEVVEAAAAAAAWFSKARGAPRVEVHVCRVSDVSKPRGAPAGQVQLARYKSMKVKPEAPETPDEP
jgi:predicted ribosome quality control (RQC) complex YloA/Tae2 family protein